MTIDRPWLAKAEHVIRAEGVRPEHEPILSRLLTDPRMDKVWSELTRRGRPDRTQFFYPAKRYPEDPPMDATAAQWRALAIIVLQAFKSVSDRRLATPIEEVETVRRRLREDAETLRRVADEIGTWAASAGAYDRAHNDMVQIVMDVQALRRVAAWRERDAAQVRGADDPLTTTYERGDQLAAAVQSDIAGQLNICFGKYMHGQAAIICAAALGLSDVPSERVSRFAILEAEKRSKRQTPK